jgi:sarcosine oxidase
MKAGLGREHMSGPQIAVIGLGATGSAALYQLARRGVSAIGIEQFAVGHDRGSSHGPTRVFRLAHYENASYVPLLQRAYALWRELEGIAKQQLVSLTGIIEIGLPDGELLTGTLAAAQCYSLPYEVLDAKTLMRRCPAYRLPPEYVAVLQPDGGIIEAGRAIEANIRIAKAAGALVRTGEKVLAIEPTGKSVRVKTDHAEIAVDGAIIAAGPWMNALLPDLHLPLRVTRQAVAWFEPRDAAQFSADRFPVFLLETQHGIHYGFPNYGSMGIKISKHHHLDQVVEPDTCDRKVCAEDEAVIRAPLAQYLPGANGRLLEAQTCLYTMTPDDTFIIDRMPGFPHIVIASPCCGHGFKFSPIVGDIVADLVTRGTTAIDISQFRLDRFCRSP